MGILDKAEEKERRMEEDEQHPGTAFPHLLKPPKGPLPGSMQATRGPTHRVGADDP